jgi:hypothetical protein
VHARFQREATQEIGSGETLAARTLQFADLQAAALAAGDRDAVFVHGDHRSRGHAAAQIFTVSPRICALAPGKGSKARRRRSMVAAGCDQAIAASAFSILCA